MGVPNIQNPAIDITPVTPSDTEDLSTISVGGETRYCRGLLVSVGGTLKIKTSMGQIRALTVPAGLIPIEARRVYSTDTAATGISALY